MIINLTGIPNRKKKALINGTTPGQTISVPSHQVQNVTGDDGEGDKHFSLEFRKAVKELPVSHNLGKKPSVTILDTSGNEILGDVEYTDNDNLTIRFSSAVRGTVYLN